MPSNNGVIRGFPKRGLWSALLLAGCSSLLGIEDSKVQGTCASKSDCAPGYDCLLGSCRDACTADAECGSGARCLKALGTSACIPSSEPCGSACPEGTSCVGGVCRTTCSTAADCAGGQECQQGSCVGLDQDHDTPPGGPVGGGGTGGEPGQMGDAGQAGIPGSSGGGEGGEGGAPVQICSPNEPVCDVNRATTCNSDGTGYAPGGTQCSATQTCLAGTCEPHECTPDQPFCAGATVRQCAANGLSSTETTVCGQQQYCDANEIACKDGVCAPNQPVCDVNRATTCNASGSGFVAGGTQCSAMQTCQAGTCLNHVCDPGETFCQANNLKDCAANGLASTLVKECTGLQCVDAGTSASCEATIDSITGITNAWGFALKNSFMLVPCYSVQSFFDCLTTTGACPNTAAPNQEDRGYVFFEFFQIGGETGKTYTVTLRVNGIVAGKYYAGGVRRNGTDFSNPDAPTGTDAWYTGGAPTASNYDVYKITVFQPDKTTEVQHYYLNSFPSNSGMESHRTVAIGYDATIDVPGQGWVKYLVGDPNCRSINNCGIGDISTSCPAPRTVPNEAALQIPATYGGVATSSLNAVNGAVQPWHAQIVHVTVKAVAEK